MNFHIRSTHYFDGKVSHGFVALFTSKAITNIGSGFFGIFMPIFLFITFGQNIYYVVLYYLASQTLYGFFLAYGVQFLNRFGFRRSLQLSTFIGALYYFELYFLNENTAFYLVPALIVTIVLWRMLYWVPYHVDFAKFSDSKNRGKEVGVVESTLSVIGVVAPIFAGFVIARFGYSVLFVLGILIYLSSLIPFLTIPRTKEYFKWTFWETWKNLFKKRNRNQVFAFMADGAETAVGIVIWPIFIYQLLNGDYLKIGAISTFVVAATVLLQLFMGKISDSNSKDKILKYGSVFYSIGWLLKIFIATAFHIFLVDTFHKLTRSFLRIPFDAITYDIAADQGHYVDEFTVLHEIAISIGRVLMYLLVIALTFFVALNWVFILAALASIALNIVHYRKMKNSR